MNDQVHAGGARRMNGGLIDFSDMALNAQSHFKLCWFGAILRVVRSAMDALGHDTFARELVFVDEYVQQLTQRGVSLTAPDAEGRWWASVEAWERKVTAHLPLRAVRLQSRFAWNAVGALVTAGLGEEDARLSAVFAALQSNTTSAPTAGLLNALWSDGETGPIRELQERGFLGVCAGPQARYAWPVQVPVWLWDVLTEEQAELRGVGWKFERDSPVRAGRDLVLSEQTSRTLAALPALLTTGTVRTVIVRGPRSSGRIALVRRLAADLGRGVLTFSPPLKPEDDRWAMIAPLATVLDALPIVELDLSAGEVVDAPALAEHSGPIAVILGRTGGLVGALAERAATLELSTLSVELRAALWKRLAPELEGSHEALATRWRMPAGRLVHLAGQAAARATLDGRKQPSLDDYGTCARALHDEQMAGLAVALQSGGALDALALPADIQSELCIVALRCRHRERLAEADHRLAANVGVRVLLTGPSGTGKTLAVRVLGAELGRQVYRLDLSAVVNKYIGETEKNLERAFSLAEELDVVLLLDEGDALLTRRTAVQSSNDRYANLETNFLLQRLESFEGIVFVTTNAAERIDSAFQRRMDAVVEFRLPEMEERRRLWELHLPQAHAVDPSLLERLAAQCTLSGGQIRNAVVHARLLAFESAGAIDGELVARAVRREYKKLGTACPLRLP